MTAASEEVADDASVIEESWLVPERFAVLFDRHSDELYRYVVRRLGPGLAEDVVADTFLTAFRKRTRYDVEYRDARPWLYGIASRTIREHRRAERRHNRELANADAPPEPFEDESARRVTAQQLRPRLAGVLAALSAPERDLLLLIAWADLTYEEAARALDIPVGTVRSRMHRLRTKIRRILPEESS